MTDRIFASAWLAVCAVIAVEMWRLAVPFSYEPVGPKAFPLLLAGLMSLCCLALLIRPDTGSGHFNLGLVAKGASLIVVLLAYGALFAPVGFPLATALMVVAVSRIFGGGWKSSTITAVVVAACSFVIFDTVLEVSLPLGRIWG
jgi:putative tricarboxylic transport membrane protein